MLPTIDRRFKVIEDQRATVLAALQPLPPERLAARPAADTWSLNEVVEHLVIAEELSLKALERTRPPETERGSALVTRLKFLILAAAFRLPIRLKVPAERLRPTGNPQLPELVARWAEARSRLAGVLAAVTSAAAADRRWRHPILGWLTTEQWVAFVDSHSRHHMAQIRRGVALPPSRPACQSQTHT